MGAVVTNLALGTNRMGTRISSGGTGRKKKSGAADKEDLFVMDTKLKIIEILEVGWWHTLKGDEIDLKIWH